MSEVSISSELDRLAEEFVSAWKVDQNTLPVLPFDAQWRSVAEAGTAPDDQVYWQPTRRSEPFSFDGIAQALEVDVPEVCGEYFGHFWSSSIPVLWGERPFELLQLWNAEDENNLMHNLLGHAMEKRRVREPLTLFFAVVDDARFLSLDAQTGAVMLEEVGGSRPEEVAADLGSLLSSVSAVATADVED